ncbi:MAG: YraN family protein [Acidobacteriota bacterium]
MTDLITRSGRIGRLQHRLAQHRRTSLGAWGEWLALRHILRLGYDVLARNWTTSHGELDLIAYDRDTLVFLEVKTRRTPSLLMPEDALTDRKKEQLERLARRFMQRHDLGGGPLRFDLVAIDCPSERDFELRHSQGVL